ncbi:MAG TPA: HAMP domain-containing sensor histidine kinase [Verrucomicrobiae bacterium]|nr:HAMP domain-containing sensor histidine kinase [Verrucomicrobiae bacterium]
MRPASRGNWYVAATWLILLGGYIVVCELVPAGAARTATANIILCLMPLLVNGALLINAVTPDWRKKAFWMLLALGCSLWMVGQTIWTYVEVYQHRRVPYLFNGDIVFFLHAVPMIAALTLQPHKRSNDRNALYGYVDFGLILCWWMYLYVFVVIPWQYVVKDDKNYIQAFSVISLFENFVFIAGAALLSKQATGQWRRTYAHLAAAKSIYVVRYLAVELLVGRSSYWRGSLYDLPLLISFLWIGTAGIIAYRNRGEEAKFASAPTSELTAHQSQTEETIWASRLARAALLSLPLIGFWCLKISSSPMAVHQFRVLVTLGAVLPLGFLAFLRHDLVDRERLRLLRASQESIDNLKRLQTQFVQSEKLASIGQLVGGAAHEINNPLTAILGYSELLADDPSVGEKTRSLAEKIREQARRTKTLVNNLLSFARQVPSEQRSPLDINAIVNTSAQFRRFDLRGKNIRIEVQTGVGIPEVRGDMNQLLQVFSNIINNAVYAMQEAGGGTLTVRTLFENGNVVILFSDTGPGMRDPRLVFDPFYTTKPVGKGTGLGLSICYGLIQDQGGQISCYNRPEGGATFRIELPAVPAAFPFAPRSVTATTRSNPAKLA